MKIFSYIYFKHHVYKKMKNLFFCIKKGFPLRLALICEVDIAKVPASTVFPHPVSIVIGGHTIIGNNCTIYQNVTVGRKYPHVNDYPILEDNIQLGAGSMILGNVRIGKNSIIGAGSVVLKNVPPKTTVVGIWK